MTCTHELWEQDTAVVADGYCPLCLVARIGAQHDKLVEAQKKIDFVLAQLRHSYMLLNSGHVREDYHKEFARGLIAPQIRRLEELRRELTSE